MNRGMTVRGGVTISSSSHYVLAGSMLRDTANESRYDSVDSNSSFRYVLAGSRNTVNESRYDGLRWYDDKLVIPLRVSAAAV